MASLFITGTDTGVGKTRIACALLCALAAAGKTTVGMKPVAAGRENGRWEDVEALLDASSVRPPRELVNPYAFEPAIAPHIAAELAGEKIDIEKIAVAHTQLCRLADIVVVEGAGGFMIPLNVAETSADLAVRLNTPIVLVVGMRLGCLNHTLLTWRAINALGLRCAGWVANCILPEMAQLERNIGSVEDRLDCPLLGTVPYQPQMSADEAATYLNVHHLLSA